MTHLAKAYPFILRNKFRDIGFDHEIHRDVHEKCPRKSEMSKKMSMKKRNVHKKCPQKSMSKNIKKFDDMKINIIEEANVLFLIGLKCP